MKRAKLLYAVMLVIMVLFFILYRGRLSLVLLIFTVLLPIPLWISVAWLKRSVQFSVCHGRKPVLKGKRFQWVIQVSNTSIFASPHTQVTIEYSNSLTGKAYEVTYVIPVLARNEERLRLSFHTATCGVMQLKVTKIVLFDPLMLFHRTLRPDLQDVILVMPEPTALLPAEWPPVPQPDSDTTEYSKTKAGNDPSEIFDLHQYREGDLISRIHWKLSSKLDNLMVKEYSLPLSAGCLLMTDYRHINLANDSALRVDAMLSALFSAALQLSEQGLSFALTSYHPDHGFTASEMFSGLGEATGWLRNLIRMHPAEPEGRPALMTAMSDFFAGLHSYERILFFTPKLDDPLIELLLAAPNPERFTVFSVAAPNDRQFPAETGYPFPCIPVMMQRSAYAAPEADEEDEEEPDYDSETLVNGGEGL